MIVRCGWCNFATEDIEEAASHAVDCMEKELRLDEGANNDDMNVYVPAGYAETLDCIRDTTLHDESPAVPISNEEVDRLIAAATEPRSIPFVRGRSIVLTHYGFEDHQEVTAQWIDKHPEDAGELWQGKAKTLRDACRNAIDAMFNSF